MNDMLDPSSFLSRKDSLCRSLWALMELGRNNSFSVAFCRGNLFGGENGHFFPEIFFSPAISPYSLFWPPVGYVFAVIAFTHANVSLPLA